MSKAGCNGSEFISKSLDGRAYFNDVQLDYSRPGTPTDNACIEAFNGFFRDECLNTNWFMSLEDAKEKIEAWKNDYNELRPHSSLTYLARLILPENTRFRVLQTFGF